MKRNEKFRELLANLNRALAGHEGYIQKRGALIEFARDKGEFSEKRLPHYLTWHSMATQTLPQHCASSRENSFSKERSFRHCSANMWAFS
jgi:hypothetical protein